MNRRDFVELITLSSGAIASGAIPGFSKSVKALSRNKNLNSSENEFSADVVIAGAGLGGFAARGSWIQPKRIFYRYSS